MPIAVFRGAANQVHLAFQAWGRRQQALALVVFEEQVAEEKTRAGEAPHELSQIWWASRCPRAAVP